VDKVAPAQVFLREHRFSRVSIIPPLFHMHSFKYHGRQVILKNDSVGKQHS